MAPKIDPDHWCDRNARRPLVDARGIFCTYICDRCEADKRSRYRCEVLENPNYDHAEPIDND